MSTSTITSLSQSNKNHNVYEKEVCNSDSANEIWKDISGYENLYQVSNLGRIRSLDRQIQRKLSKNGNTYSYYKKGQIFKIRNEREMYLSVDLCKNGKHKKQIHKLVAKAFVANPNGLLDIIHKDENKFNNAADNLEWRSMDEKAIRICLNCNQTFSIGENPSGNTLKKIYCGSRCKENAGKKRRGKQKYCAVKRRREWEATKADPERLARKRQQDIKACGKTRQWLSDYKMERGCVDCGYKEHFSALQLDHEGFKTLSISDARTSVKRLEKEIKDGQCVVRCANCHSIITWKRKVGLI